MRGSAALLMGMAACSSGGGDAVVFESVTTEAAPCPDDTRGADCFVVVAPVVGQGRGTGRCVVYASSDDRNLFVAAERADIELEPGDTVRWEVALSRPSDPAFREWNAVCLPTIEG